MQKEKERERLTDVYSAIILYARFVSHLLFRYSSFSHGIPMVEMVLLALVDDHEQSTRLRAESIISISLSWDDEKGDEDIANKEHVSWLV